jgi:hypothetical protein
MTWHKLKIPHLTSCDNYNQGTDIQRTVYSASPREKRPLPFILVVSFLCTSRFLYSSIFTEVMTWYVCKSVTNSIPRTPPCEAKTYVHHLLPPCVLSDFAIVPSTRGIWRCHNMALRLNCCLIENRTDIQNIA